MSFRVVLKAWNELFFKPQSPVPISLFRILYGACVIATLILLHSDWLNWYGADSWVSLATMTRIEPGIRIDLFSVIPQNDAWIEAFFWLSLVFAVLLTVGLFTRISSVITFLCVASIQQRNLLILHSGDTFLRVAGFFLIFAPAGAALSLDRLIRIWAGREGQEIQPRRPWAQRMIQFELMLLYLTAAWWKSMGASWVNGTALYYVSHLDAIRRFPVPSWTQQPLLQKLGSWFTLILEFSLGALLWIKELRYPLLLTGLLFHLCLEYSFNLPMFEWDVLSAYVLFVEPADLRRMWERTTRALFGQTHQRWYAAKRAQVRSQE